MQGSRNNVEKISRKRFKSEDDVKNNKHSRRDHFGGKRPKDDLDWVFEQANPDPRSSHKDRF